MTNQQNTVAFRRTWLRDHGLRAESLSLVDITGDSLQPTLWAGDSALIDHARLEPCDGRIFALRTAEGPLAKRLRQREGRWWAHSDNPEYAPRVLDEGETLIGELVWWAHTARGRESRGVSQWIHRPLKTRGGSRRR